MLTSLVRKRCGRSGIRPSRTTLAAVGLTSALIALEHCWHRTEEDCNGEKLAFVEGCYGLHPSSTACYRPPEFVSPHSSSWNRPIAVDSMVEPVQCDTTTAWRPPTFRLRRLPTIQKLEETKTEDRLETHYFVDYQQPPLGEGAFGVVYAGTHRQTGQSVAIKKIPERYTTHKQLQRELDALMVLRDNGGHPHICGLRENFHQNGDYYLVMDRVAGREVFDQLCVAGAYSEADAARHIQEVASALAFLHGIGMIHCDVKPENLMLSSRQPNDALIKLVDLGCAVVQTPQNTSPSDSRAILTSIAGTANTPAYCPPEVLEQIRTQNDKNKEHRSDTITVSPSFDMWSLGVVIYIMLAGVHPFDLECQATNDEIEDQILSGEKPPLRNSKYTQHLSNDAIALMEGLLERDPKKRLTAEQVLENPWVRGETASSKKIADSDQRLKAYRKFKTKIGSAFFKALLSETDAIHRRHSSERTSVLESAFRRLDTRHEGYISTKDIQGDDDTHKEQDAKLSYSDISALLAENLRHRYFAKGHVIYKEGDKGDSMFVIDSGTVEVTKRNGFQKFRRSGEIFGEGSLFRDGHTKHVATVRCTTPVHVLEISRELFKKYLASDSETFLSMVEQNRYRKRERASTILRYNSGCQQKVFRKHNTIFRAGDQSGDLVLVDDGELEISVNGHKVRTIRKGEMAGEHAAYFGTPYNVTLKCVSDSCRIRSLPSKTMHKLFQADPTLRGDFRDLLLRRDFKKALVVATNRSFPSTNEEIRTAFDSIDTDRSGKIEFEQLRSIVRQFDPNYNEEDIRAMLDSLDLNQSGSLTWEAFHRIFTMDKDS